MYSSLLLMYFLWLFLTFPSHNKTLKTLCLLCTRCLTPPTTAHPTTTTVSVQTLSVTLQRRPTSCCCLMAPGALAKSISKPSATSSLTWSACLTSAQTVSRLVKLSLLLSYTVSYYHTSGLSSAPQFIVWKKKKKLLQLLLPLIFFWSVYKEQVMSVYLSDTFKNRKSSKQLILEMPWWNDNNTLAQSICWYWVLISTLKNLK